ncbi:MAG: hypothetical protein K9H49_11265 [Bacteroidales bacterium]|nr:hypothetical protein [Bacteroidales bacterium]MCF8389997.1 hypothetical protein [Bacteroidales bacterium]
MKRKYFLILALVLFATVVSSNIEPKDLSQLNATTMEIVGDYLIIKGDIRCRMEKNSVVINTSSISINVNQICLVFPNSEIGSVNIYINGNTLGEIHIVSRQFYRAVYEEVMGLLKSVE